MPLVYLQHFTPAHALHEDNTLPPAVDRVLGDDALLCLSREELQHLRVEHNTNLWDEGCDEAKQGDMDEGELYGLAVKSEEEFLIACGQDLAYGFIGDRAYGKRT